MSMTDRQVLAKDSRVLREAALRGSVYVRWPDDQSWLKQIEGIGDPLRQLQGMKKRGSLASIARGRWIVMPPGASTIAQAAPPPILLAALLDGRAEWYLGFLSALIDHGLTDIDSETLYVPRDHGHRFIHGLPDRNIRRKGEIAARYMTF
jgi:predicted transcriptional regulator of viral defense system